MRPLFTRKHFKTEKTIVRFNRTSVFDDTDYGNSTVLGFKKVPVFPSQIQINFMMLKKVTALKEVSLFPKNVRGS